jgi:hypothetical protein
MTPRIDNVVYLQDGRRGAYRRRPTVPPLFAETELQAAEGLAGIAALVVAALEAAHLTQEAAAVLMGISASLFSRQLQNLDNQHLSLQRLDRLPDAFWLELMVLVVERRKLARVRRRALVFDVGA